MGLRVFWDKLERWKWPEEDGEHNDRNNSIRRWISRSIQTMFDFRLNFEINCVEDELKSKKIPGGLRGRGEGLHEGN